MRGIASPPPLGEPRRRVATTWWRLSVRRVARHSLLCMTVVVALLAERAAGFAAVAARAGGAWPPRLSLGAEKPGLSMVAMHPQQEVLARSAARSRAARSLRTSSASSLPWRESISGPEHSLSYMPFMEWAFYELGSRFELEAMPVPEELAYAENLAKPGRIASLLFRSKEIRRLRLTYFDAGPAVQVLNAVLYPDPSLDVPVLGLDLISFNNRHLAGMDFQPLYDDPKYRERYAAPLRPVKARYPELGQRMSQRFYDSARFFSDEMLFARYEDANIIPQKLFPAFTETVAAYANILQEAAATKAAAAPAQGVDEADHLGRHMAYDQYNAERDPAHGLFVGYFGEAWAERFMGDFLFELSTRPVGGYAKVHGACG